MTETPNKILPETSGWDAEADEHPRIKWLYRILMGLGTLLGIAFGIAAYLYFTPVIISKTHDNGKYEYGIQRYEYWRYNALIRSGISKSWNSNGQLVYHGYYDKGKKHGIEETWYTSGQLRNRYLWSNDKKNGLIQYWHPNGKLAYEA
ncbi:MAG: hypothetical protein ABIH86_04020, partial [Planctomycetota bacterium]